MRKRRGVTPLLIKAMLELNAILECFFFPGYEREVQILMFAVLKAFSASFQSAISEVTAHVRRCAGQCSSLTHCAQFYMRGDNAQKMEAVRFSLRTRLTRP